MLCDPPVSRRRNLSTVAQLRMNRINGPNVRITVSCPSCGGWGGATVRTTPKTEMCAQKTHLSPNWMRRGSEAVTIRPAAGRPTDVFGRPKTGVLVKLNDSNRNCT